MGSYLDFMPPWVKWLGALLVVVAIVAAIYAYGQKQFGLGEQAERATWLKRDNDALVQANAKIKQLEEDARATERRHAESIAQVSKKYQEELQHAKSRKDRVIADLRAGDQRLRIPVAATGCAGGSEAGTTSASAVRRDGEARAELSDAAAEFLVGLATEADEIVHQLNACQALVIEDRNTYSMEK